MIIKEKNMSKKIKIAIAGIGNCASSLIQGIHYYKNFKSGKPAAGLMHYDLGGYKISDIEVVAAFDIDKRKVGKDLSEAIYAKPNCTRNIVKRIPKTGVKVKMGKILDGFSPHMKNYPPERTFVLSKEKAVDVVKELKLSGTQILINYCPVGSERATAFYAKAALEAKVAFINCIPVFIASDKKWARRFKSKNLPIIGDDIKSQIGATIVHRVLTHLFVERGVSVEKSYQLNVGGNTDFLNMLSQRRLKSKKISKTESVESQLKERLSYENLHIGPSDWVPWLKDNKIAFIRIEGREFGNIPMNLELRLSVEDSPNSGGCVIDAIRLAKIALERKIGGVLVAPSAFLMKHPPLQMTDEQAYQKVEEFIKG